MKNISLLLFVIPAAIAGWMLFDGSIRIGRALNAYMPCVQHPEYSFPCYGTYEIWLMAALGCVSLIGFVLLIVSLRKKS